MVFLVRLGLRYRLLWFGARGGRMVRKWKMVNANL